MCGRFIGFGLVSLGEEIMSNLTEQQIVELFKDAPEGATHYGHESGVFYGGFYKIEHNKEKFYHDGNNWLDCISTPELTERPKPEVKTVTVPVYTQELFGNHIPPSAGDSFIVYGVKPDSRLFDFKDKEVKVIGLSKKGDEVVITFSHPSIGIGCGMHWKKWVKPLTPPVVLDNGKAYAFVSKTHGGGIGYYNSNNKEFVNINMGISINHCTNIQELGVKS